MQGCVFHLHITPKAAGTAIAASEYQSRSGKFRNREDRALGGAIGWDGTTRSLWEEAEKAEQPKRQRVREEERQRSRRVARSVVIALPASLTEGERAVIVQDFAVWINKNHGVAVQFDVHRPEQKGGKNHHAHLLISTRLSNGSMLGRKARTLDQPHEIARMREVFAQITNEAMARAKRPERCDHRSHRQRAAEQRREIAQPARPRLSAAEWQRERTTEQPSAIRTAHRRAMRAFSNWLITSAEAATEEVARSPRERGNWCRER
jgi:hypothetical protein